MEPSFLLVTSILYLPDQSLHRAQPNGSSLFAFNLSVLQHPNSDNPHLPLVQQQVL